MDLKDPATVTRGDLFAALWSQPLATVAERLGMTANGLAKLCDRIGLARPDRAYWNAPPAARDALRPPAPEGPDARLPARPGPSALAREPRVRMTMDQRRAQLLDIAARIVRDEGVAEVSLKRLAAEAGITEAQVHNCVGKRIDVLLDLTRRELAAVEQARKAVVDRGHDYTTAVVLSTLASLEAATGRGPMLQALLAVAEVRRGLRAERKLQQDRVSEPVLSRMRTRYGLSDEEARCSNAILTAVTRRGGALLAAGRLTMGQANRLVLAFTLAGMRSNAEAAAARRNGRTD